MAILKNLTLDANSNIKVPAGSAQQGPQTTVSSFTSVGSTTWTCPAGVTSIEVLVVAGGGGGGGGGSGGGGGGVVYHPKFSVTPGTGYTVTVGDGGNGGSWGNGANGGNSAFSTLIATGGGGGAHSGNGIAGGSGGGGGYQGTTWAYSDGGASNQPSYTGATVYGNPGGKGCGYSANGYPGAGGGGAGGPGFSATLYGTSDNAQAGGDGGPGIAFSISGTTTYYAGGGGGSNRTVGIGDSVGRGGIGGGGAGTITNGIAGTSNTGGGGGAGASSTHVGGKGGSGIVIIKYETTTVVESFTNVGSHAWICPTGVTSAEILIVGAGGGGSADWGNGGGQGGGGAGGVLYKASHLVTPGTSYLVKVGAGGVGGKGATQSNQSGGAQDATSHGKPGSSSQFDTFIALGGGGGAGSGATTSTQYGGSGGGGGYTGIKTGGLAQQTSYSGWTSYGNNGGDHSTQPTDPGWYSGGGGGGAGGVGQKGQGSSGNAIGGAGGPGIAFSITGTSVVYAAGGGGGTFASGTGGAGGSGVGGSGGSGATNPAGRGTEGRANTGSGGGGGGGPGSPTSIGADGGNGADGIVIIKYTLPTTNQLQLGSQTGQTRINTSTKQLDFYINGSWKSTYTTFADGSSPERAAVSAAMIKQMTGTTTSGVYWIKWDGTNPVPIWCEMNLMGGGWMMIANYVHKGGTNPTTFVRTNSFPLLNHEYDLGPDESASTDTYGTWGHISNSLAAQNPWTEYMFYGKTNFHSRVIHFYGNQPNIVSYIKTGTGSMVPYYAERRYNWNGSLYNNATIPLFVQSDRSGFSNQGNNAMTEFPIYGESTIGNPRCHWAMGGQGARWEVDDYPGSQGAASNFAQNTIHRIWVR